MKIEIFKNYEFRNHKNSWIKYLILNGVGVVVSTQKYNQYNKMKEAGLSPILILKTHKNGKKEIEFAECNEIEKEETTKLIAVHNIELGMHDIYNFEEFKKRWLIWIDRYLVWCKNDSYCKVDDYEENKYIYLETKSKVEQAKSIEEIVELVDDLGPDILDASFSKIYEIKRGEDV